MLNEKKLQRIVIVGGGAGGLELATRLAKKVKKTKATIILVDVSPIHIWKPLLHEVAAGTLNSHEDEVSYLAYASQHKFQFILGSMQGLNRLQKEIILAPVLDQAQQELIPERKLPYDILVIAVGSISNDFNTPGVREHCLFIDNHEQASNFQQTFLKTIMHFAYESENNHKELHIAIIGGGATGIELAAELHYAVYKMASYGIPFDPSKVSFTVIEAANRLLPGLPEYLSQTALHALKKVGIEVYVNEHVNKVAADGLYTNADRFIPATIKVWAAGIKAPDLLKTFVGLKTNKNNQLIVRQTLQTTKNDDIFAFGDCAYCLEKGSNKPVPPRAQAAHQQASFLTKSIDRLLKGKPLPLYHYKNFGSLISLGSYQAVGALMGRFVANLKIEGKLARLAYLSLYRQHQVVLYGFWRVAALIVANFLTRKVRPRLKMH